MTLLGLTPLLHLGDVPGFPAQTGEIQRLFVEGTAELDWGSSSGGQPGGLTFSQDDPADFGVGVRIGRRTGFSPSDANFYGASNTPPEAFNLVLGPLNPFWYRQSNLLQLFAARFGTPAPLPTLHLSGLRLESSPYPPPDDGYAEVRVFQNLVVGQVQANGGGARVNVGSGTFQANDVVLRPRGANQIPLQIGYGGTAEAEIGVLDLRVEHPNEDATILVGDLLSSPSAIADVGTAALQANDEARAGLVIDGGTFTRSASLSIELLEAAGLDGGAIEVVVRNGGSLDVQTSLFEAFGSSAGGVASALRVAAHGVGSRLSGHFLLGGGDGRFEVENGAECDACDVTMSQSSGGLRFAGGAIATGATFRVDDATAEFTSGATVLGSVLLLGSGGTATIDDTASARFAGIQITADLLAGSPASATIGDTNSGSPPTEVVSGTVNVGSDYGLGTDGTALGGDRPGLPSSLVVRDGAQLRIGDDPARPVVPLLAIGTNGSVTVDPASGVFIGDALTPAAYQIGAIVVDDGGYLRGNGVVNGASFGGGANPAVVNTGGDVGAGFSPGRLTIDGVYVQASGVLQVEIGGSQPGEYDVLDASAGVTILGGAIRFTRLAKFSGQIGDQLDLFAGRNVAIDPSVTVVDESGLGLAFDVATGIATITQTPGETFACANGEDDDGDGYVDLRDPGCAGTGDASEQTARPGCDDGLDNEGDGLADMQDPGCPDPVAPYENPACDNGLDDDGDGLVDAADPVCQANWPYWEELPPGCGFGAELPFVLAALRRLANGRRSGRRR